MKQMLTMSGMSNFYYWIGLFLADLVLLILPFVLFFIFVLATQMEGFADELGKLMLVILSFGSSLIPLVYLASTWYKDTVTASKCIAPWLIIFGNVVPGIVFPLFWGIALSINENVGIMFGSLVYILNPFATFFCNSYTVLMWHFVGKGYEEAREANEEYCSGLNPDEEPPDYCDDLKEENEIDSA